MKKITLLLLFIGSYVSAQYTAIPDPNFEQALIDLGYDTMLDGQVLTDNIDDVISLDVSSKSISSLIGIEDFNALQVLMCHFNAISELDLSNNSQLHFFGCSNNQIEAIDFSNNILLESVDLRNNPLIVLDMSHNLALTNLAVWGSTLTALNIKNNTNLVGLVCNDTGLTNLDVSSCPLTEGFYCRDNSSLTILDLRNGNNNAINPFDATNNSNLSCVFVDDKNNIPSHWIIDPNATYMETEAECGLLDQYTLIPDINFEQSLIDIGYDNSIDGRVLTANIENIQGLNVSNINISDLNGIEDFISLTMLSCGDNNLTTLNLNNNTSILDLYCSNNFNLSSLDISNCLLLENIQSYNNLLNNLDVSNQPNLKTLYVFNTQINNIDVSQNTQLRELIVLLNQITSLDLSNNPELRIMDCRDNPLETLNIKNGNNNIVETFWATNNPNLTCIEVDDEVAANAGTGVYATWLKDPIAIYSEDCTLGIKFSNKSTFNLYPNPTKNSFIINGKSEIEKVFIYNIFGKLIKTFPPQKQYDVSGLSKGLYLINIKNEMGSSAEKLIID